MTTTDFKNVYWRYYLTLEKDVLEIEPYVSFHPNNFNCFSMEFVKIYQAICAEIDGLCKEYCKYINTAFNQEKNKNINCYAKYILTERSEFDNNRTKITNQNIRLTEYIELTPWERWNVNNTPGWWKTYNQVKHTRSDNYQHANLNNVLNSLAALYVLEKYFYADLAKDEAEPGKIPNIIIDTASKLFGCLQFENQYLQLQPSYF